MRIAEGSEEEFKNDRHLYGIKAIRNVGYGYWQKSLPGHVHMSTYRVTAVSINIHAGVLVLDSSQADARMHRLTPLGGNRYRRGA